MATPKTNIILSAEDRTAAAFASAKRGLDGFSGSLSKVSGLMAGLGVGVSVAGLTAFVKTSIDAADAISKLSVKTGISVENLTGWQHAMDLSGTTTEQFEMAVGKLNTTIAKNPEKLRALGVTATDANGALLQLSDAFSRIEDPTRRAAIAAEIFGERVGRNMVVALSQGRAAMEDQIRVGQQLNPITTKLAQDSEKFNDALATLQKRGQTVGVTLANVVLPALNNVLGQMEEGIRIAGGFGQALKFGLSINPFNSPGENLKGVRAEIKTLESMRDDLQSGKRASARYKDGRVFFAYDIGEVDKEIGELKKRAEFIKVLRAQSLGLDTKSELARKAAADRAGTKGALATDDYFDKTGSDKTKAKLELDEIDPFGKERRAAEKAALAEKVAAEEAAFNELADLRDYQNAQDEKAAAALGRMRDELLGLIDPIQQYRDKLEEVDLLQREGMLTADQATEARFYWQEQIDGAAGFGKELEKVTDDFAKKMQESFQQGLSDFLFDPFAEGADGMVKKFSQTLQRMAADAVAADISRMIFGDNKGGGQNLFGTVAEFFGFANGGIMSAGGPLPLKRYASGGIATSPQLAMFGEGSMNEAYVPLPDGRSIPVSMRGGGGTTVNVTIQANDLSSFQRSEGQISASLSRAVASARRFQ